MKPTSFTLDKRLYELLQDEGLTQFTTASLRDAYASRLGGTPYKLGEVRRYVYEQIRRMLRAGWLVLDDERRKRGQVYHLRPMPEHLQLKLIDNGFEKSLKPEHKTKRTSPEPSQSLAASGTEAEVYQRLESTLKEVRLDFLTSMGETERYKLLLDEMPHLRSHVEHEYQEAKDRSSRLLGHLRAVEKTLTALPSQ
ncbi:hypothetical protein QLQ85_15825 [Halomonas sp. M4R5S39]|uniref:hypothetical protein n=1 Tax=Halomonas kalidii TaxID=3043293 RepID=UPI0024A9F5DF|nr:hypothetical protein [Halomonas kalidii]MDI5986262.1 hypothetical protein [Halomonas kalidii]